MEMRRKGQVFIMGAVIFSSIVLLAITSTQQTYTSNPDAEISTYFESVLERQSEALDSGLNDNFSIESARNELYSFNRFVERQSQSRNIEYRALQVAAVPERERAVIINYRPMMANYSYHGVSWSNGTLGPRQYEIIGIERSTEYRFMSPQLNIDTRFNASEPAFLGHVRMDSGDSVLTDQVFR